MDFASADWLRELEIEELNLFHQCEVNSSASHTVNEFLSSSLSPESYSPCISLNDMEALPAETSPTTHIHTQVEQEQLISDSTGNSFNPENLLMDEPFPSSHVVEQPTMQFNESPSFGCFNSPGGSDDIPSDKIQGKRANQLTSRAPMQAKNHVMAERKRRERLNQKLISLAALLPGLKKMDKASVLGDAVKYIKQLEERVHTLEVEAQKKKEEPTIHSAKRSRLSSDDSSSSNEELDGNFNKPLPDIQARILDKNVLVIRLQHKKQDGIIEKVLSQVQILHSNVITSNVIPLSDAILDITILAQMADGFCATAKEFVRNLRSQLAVLS